MQLGVSQPNCGAAVMCRPAHGRPVLPFVLSANNCLSENFYRMLLSNMTVTTGQHQNENIWVLFWLRALYYIFVIFLVIEFKISPNFELCLICRYLKFMFENHILE